MSKAFLSLFTVAAVFLLAGPAVAGMKTGKVSTTLTNPANVTGPFTNGTSKGTFSFKGTKAVVKAKGTTVPDTDGVPCSGDEVICLLSVHANVSLGGPLDLTIILGAEASGGKVIASRDLCKDRDKAIAPESYFFCPEFFGALGTISLSQVDLVCYAPDPAWLSGNAPDFPMNLAGHTCEGLKNAVSSPPQNGVLFSSGSTILVQ